MNAAPRASIAGAGVGGGRVHVLLHQDLRVEVGDLRAGDHQRVPAGRAPAGDQHGVGRRERQRGAREAERRRARRAAPAGFARPRSRAASATRGPAAPRARGRFGRALVREALAEHRRRRLGVLGRAEVAERAQALALAEALLQRVGDLRPRRAPRRRPCRRCRRPARRWRSGPPPSTAPGPAGGRCAAYSPGSFVGSSLRLGDVGVDAGDVVARRRAGSACRPSPRKSGSWVAWRSRSASV